MRPRPAISTHPSAGPAGISQPFTPPRSAAISRPPAPTRPAILSRFGRLGYNWLILLLFTYFSLPVAAQFDQYRFARLDISQGLSHNEVNCLLRDEKGFLWIGT
ncbi:MAG: two-component regulator propeller domain-containing protein, partial [Bacteroidota bacterium]